ncbi:MAG: glycosyltransferase [Actinomycetaceae bacterium]|nr:glycosyltransferase [Actinomycetaceae bacterium]
MTTEILQRLVFPVDRDPDVLPLYAEGDSGFSRETFGPRVPGEVITVPGKENPTQVLSRTTYRVPAGHRTSFGTYFNAFPASYWATYTRVKEVELKVQVSGSGMVMVSRSNAKGHGYRVASQAFQGQVQEEISFTLPLNTFGDGGWYWFDVIATDSDVSLEGATWESAKATDLAAGKASVAITTFNRQADCVEVLRQLGADAELSDVLDRILVVDQGDRKVSDHPEFATVAESLEGLLEIIEQPNLGGSGGFSRGMFEAVERGSKYVMLLDDDVRVETEGIKRAVRFANAAKTDTIVGGHMFSMYERTKLHALAEVIDSRRMWWTPAPGTKLEHDFAVESLRSTAWLHERAVADYNGWWMCLIPTNVVREIGLSLPLFIKWDDSEYGLRAREANIPVVSLPGAALWHVPFTSKDDSLEWQAYFHTRNRLIAGLLHTRYKSGKLLLLDSFANTIKHVISAQYSTAHLRDLAASDILRGPAYVRQTLASCVGKAREERSKFTDAQPLKDPQSLIGLETGTLSGARVRQKGASSKLGKAVTAAKAVAHQLRPVANSAKKTAQTVVPFPAQRWWTLAGLDSALVFSSDGSSVSLYQRDRDLAKRQFERSSKLYRRLASEWDSLSELYRTHMDELVGPQSWAEVFEAEYHPDRWVIRTDDSWSLAD